MAEDLRRLSARLREIANEIDMLVEEYPGLEKARRGQKFRSPDLEIDLDSGRCLWHGKVVNGLSRAHLLIIEYLSRYPDWIRTREELLNVVDPTAEKEISELSIDSHIKRIRAKFSALDENFDCIQAVYGYGYRWRSAP